MTAPIFVAEPDTPEWHEARKTGIGASDAGAAIGASPYDNQLSLYRRKRGEIPDVEENELMAHGKYHEPATVRLWEYLTQREMQAYPMSMYRDAEHEFMLATPDGELEDGHGVEIKQMGTWVAKKIDDSSLAAAVPHYIAQINQQMRVMNWDRVTIVADVDRKIRTWTEHRSDKLIALLIRVEADLWDRIQTGRPPEINKNHPRLSELVKSVHPGILHETAVTLSVPACEALDRCERRR
ncbi:MAG TPA: YqaJ viral recombinase family protein, partial [Phycisphaerae bacterium]|nr:YqaJ viral recombinase family protein [Phycisphaerae bacterium]